MKKLALMIVAVCTAAAACAQAPDAVRTIDVTGEALVLVVPDRASVTLGIESYDAVLPKAQAANAASGRKLLDMLKAQGIEDTAIQTSDLTVSIQYKDSSHPSRGIDGYTVSRDYTVTLKNPKSLSGFVTQAIAAGANSVWGISYSTTELRARRDEARAEAIRAAREKAAAMAAELGCSLGKPRSISEQGQQYFRSGLATQNVMRAYADTEASGGDVTEEIPVGQVGVRASVHVVFDLVVK